MAAKQHFKFDDDGNSAPVVKKLPGPLSLQRLNGVVHKKPVKRFTKRPMSKKHERALLSEGLKKNLKRSAGSKKVVNFSDSSDDDSDSGVGERHNRAGAVAVNAEITKQRMSLPMYRAKDKVLEVIKKQPVTILVGETGSGKSTQLPQLLLDAKDARERIAITQPRRVAAISLASRVSQERGTQLGDTVGYSVRFQQQQSARTKIKYLTDGMLLREMLLDPLLSRYTTVILDEAHERTVITDILMGLLKRLLNGARQGTLKVVVMSATLDAEKFAAFFGSSVPVLYVEGRSHPVQRYYLKQPLDDIVLGVCQAAAHVNKTCPAGDVLVFLPGQDEIDKSVERINTQLAKQEKAANPKVPLMAALPLYASLPHDQQQKAFEPAAAGTRKVILATNIAETSLTIPGVRYVVDSGLRKVRIWKSELGMDTLLTTSISQSAASQRMGRAGREAPGVCFRLFTEDTYLHELSKQTESEIMRCDIASTILMLKRANVDDVLGFEWLESPGRPAILSALMKLYSLRALDDEGRITQLGQQMAVLPVSPSLAAVLLQAKKLVPEHFQAVIDITACLSVEDLLVNPHPDLRDEVNERRLALFASGREHGDLVMLKEMYDAYKSLRGTSREKREWCKSVGVNHRSIGNVDLVRTQLARYVQYELEDDRDAEYSWDVVVKAFLYGFVGNTALATGDRKFKTVTTGQTISIHPSSMLFGQALESIMYVEYVFTTKGYARTVSPVRAEWLREIAPHLLGRKEA